MWRPRREVRSSTRVPGADPVLTHALRGPHCQHWSSQGEDQKNALRWQGQWNGMKVRAWEGVPDAGRV